MNESPLDNNFNQAESFNNKTLKKIISFTVVQTEMGSNLWACHIFGLTRGNSQLLERNCFRFIGALVSFIDNDWNYVVQHLSLKLISWKQKGSLLAELIVNVLAKHGIQRKISNKTDSGSNNTTMAKMMHHKILELDGSDFSWDYDTIHIKCFCHKMVLKPLPHPKSRKPFLDLFLTQII
ncbi:hypothetical protein VP01_972g2 [Puccinia sorghi]|uniref:Uncharacterized protein n=1 Tax=Puccinia sorghi TaxID=27349 RepID=A0A0L6U5W8_9BASI|nr:hypothetical protein VP01_972g2 [Puccinia sorghi]